jgi:uncharacterized repeat protein (TIGR01451 family)
MKTRAVTRLIQGGLILGLAAGLLTPAPSVIATPVHSNPTTYNLCDRVFTDPHAYWPAPAPPDGQSPYAKGTGLPGCRAVDFMTYQEMKDGMTFLESLFPQFVDFIKLEEDFGGNDNCATSTSQTDYCSAGLPRIGGTRQREDLYMVRITDERSAAQSPGNLPLADKKYFAFPLSIHGIERAGAEGGTRAAEDLATWAYCEAVMNGEPVSAPASSVSVNCPQEGIPHPLLEAQSSTPNPNNLSAGQALKRSAIYFIWANPDGWRRGDPDNIARFYQRYNGNGVDMNRDWPNIGFTFEPYTPWSEPETKGFGEVLQQIRPQWDGGIDLHGQLIDRAFSFTLLGALPNGDYSQNQRVLQTVRGAWLDAEQRLGWHPLIIPNDAPPPTCVPTPVGGSACDGYYGVQWGTVWDTIDYTVTGAFGDWIASPIGLGADGIDNEMSMSHLSNCGTGTCYEPNFEQLHIDGNKSLVYAMVNFSLLPEDDTFVVPGKVGYVASPKRLQNDGSTGTPPPSAGLDPQPDILNVQLDATNSFMHVFDVKGPLSTPPYYNGGITGTVTPAGNLNGVGGTSVSVVSLERFKPTEQNPDPTDTTCDETDDDWEVVNTYYNQASTYLQAGQAVHTNNPSPGAWRICLEGDLATQLATSGGFIDLDITFQEEEAFHLPPGGQAPYDVSNMDFFDDLGPNMDPGQLVAVTADEILNGQVDLDQFRSLVIADDAFPGFVEPAKTGPAQPPPAGSPFSDPGLLTAPCGYQRGTSDVPPGSNNPPPGCSVSFPFTVDPAFNNTKIVAALDTSLEGVNDWDLYIDRQDPDTLAWGEAGRSAGATGDERVTVFSPPPGDYRVLLVNWAGTATSFPQTLSITFDNAPVGPPPPPSTRTPADIANWKSKLLAFVQGGGNLVLTDGAILNLDLLDIVERPKISNFSVYAGFIGFTTDGTNNTYDDPLAANVNQPGAAEGPQHRHQTNEPVPLGYAIQDPGGSDFNSAPVWAVDQDDWEAAGARTVGLTTPKQVTLGELPLGAGRIRIIGPLLPMPTESYYHPFGLANYALTYTGYQVLNNALQWQRPGTDLAITKTADKVRAATGRNLTYTLTVTNNGPATAPFVVVTDTLPPSVTFVSATSPCAEAAGIVTCNLGTMASGATANIQIVVQPNPPTGVITNVASVTSSADDTIGGNNSASVQTTVCRITSRRTSIPCE